MSLKLRLSEITGSDHLLPALLPYNRDTEARGWTKDTQEVRREVETDSDSQAMLLAGVASAQVGDLHGAAARKGPVRHLPPSTSPQLLSHRDLLRRSFLCIN